jgi:hypothetical protein
MVSDGKTELSLMEKNKRLAYIIEKGKIVSRTANTNGTYSEKIIYEPPFCYQHNELRKGNSSYCITIHTASRNKLM